MSLYEITVTGQDGDYLLISDAIKNYKGRIHKSLIEDNNLIVTDGKTTISDTMYQEWFKESKEEAYEELCDLFYSHIPLFVEKQEIIQNNPMMYSIIAPRAFYEGMFIGSRPITLGELLYLWEKDPLFSFDCDCNGKKVIYFFAGSPLSGSCYVSCVCLQCGKILKDFRKRNFNDLLLTRKKYHPIEPFIKEPASVSNLIAFLKGKIDKLSSEKPDDFHGVPDNMTIRIGSSSISNEAFASILHKGGFSIE